MFRQQYQQTDLYNYSQELNRDTFQDIQGYLSIANTLDIPTFDGNKHIEQQNTIKNHLQQLPKTIKKQKHTINNYPTKNCLPFFKTAHFFYLTRENFNYKKHPQIMKIKQKKGIARQDFVMLYNIKGMRNIWSKMFNQKFLYKYIMVSRVLSKQKRTFQSKVKRLELAFTSLQFDRLTDS